MQPRHQQFTARRVTLTHTGCHDLIDTLMCCHQYNATDWAPVRITSPVDGSVLRGDSVLLSFEVSASVLHRLAYIEARASDEEVTRVGPGVRQLTLHGVEPGTHHVSLWLLDGQEACIGQADVLWDTAFPEGEMLTHRLLSRPEPPPPLRLSSSSRSAGVEGGPRRIKLCFVTSLKLDGQRMIYLQQLQRLPRERYEMVVLNNHSPRAREEEGRVFVQQLADMAIPLVRTSGLSVAVDDVEVRWGAHPRSRSWGEAASGSRVTACVMARDDGACLCRRRWERATPRRTASSPTRWRGCRPTAVWWTRIWARRGCGMCWTR